MMKKIFIWRGILILHFFLMILHLNAQTIQHPVIWISDEEKPQLLQKIEDYTWAENIVTKLHNTVDGKVNLHINNPAYILNTIPTIPNDDNLSESEATHTGDHAKILIYASYSGILYYLTGEEKYAQFSADILYYYIDELAERTPETTTISGNYFYDPRTSYAQFSIAYDFIHHFLTTPGVEVFDLSKGKMVQFDNSIAQKAIVNIAENSLLRSNGADKHGKFISNHPVLTSPGALFSILCIEDDDKREQLFNVFWEEGTSRQNSFKNTILPMFGSQGIWPESTSYSFMPNITMILNIIDKIKPEMNVMAGNMSILDGNFLFDNLRMPDRRFVRYGDSKRNIDVTEALYQNTLDIAIRRGLTEYEQKAKVALRQKYNASGGFNPSVSTSTFDNYDAYRNLFWSVDIPQTIESEINFQSPTVIIEHAGIALQRNSVEQNNSTYGLCGIIGGAHYVHSHVTGISMEIYGSGYVMGPGGGLSPNLAGRRSPEHREYFMRHAGNNTVIVNGTSHGRQSGSWGSDLYVWQNTTVNVAAEPKHLQDPVSDNFSFATQYLGDQVNNCAQQRTLSTIRTSETTAYYFDMFRSRSNVTNNFHDYVYHNLGDAMHIFDKEDNEKEVTSTDMYDNHIGDYRKSPGWIHFENTKVTKPTADAVKIRFDLNHNNRHMHMFVPSGIEREYTKALGPATREAKNGYVNKKTQIIAIRQQGEAWDKPYVNIFEPTKSSNPSVVKTEHLYNGDAIVGAKVFSQINNKTIEDYIICMPGTNKSLTLPEYGISFTGRFAIVRYEQDIDEALTTLYIGEGESLSYGDIKLNAGDDENGILVESGEPYFGRQILFRDINNNDVIARGSNLNIEAVVGEEYIKATLWVNDTVNIGTLSGEPYIWSDHPSLTNMKDEVYKLTIEAEDTDGVSEKKTITIRTPTQMPYTDNGEPHKIPGRIQFEDYDSGGEELGYIDATEQNLSLYTYRGTDDVDLDRDGTVVSSFNNNEWLEYTINVEKAGVYNLKVRHRTEQLPDIEAFSVISANSGDTLIKNSSLLYTGRSDYYVDDIGDIYLDEGDQVLRYSFLNSGFNLDYMELSFLYSMGIKDFVSNNSILKVYPNPTNGAFTIALNIDKTDKAVVCVYSMSGNTIGRYHTTGNNIRINNEGDFEPGIYFVKVVTENQEIFHGKVIIR